MKPPGAAEATSEAQAELEAAEEASSCTAAAPAAAGTAGLGGARCAGQHQVQAASYQRWRKNEFVNVTKEREFGDLVQPGETLTLEVGSRQAASERETKRLGLLRLYDTLYKAGIFRIWGPHICPSTGQHSIWPINDRDHSRLNGIDRTGTSRFFPLII